MNIIINDLVFCVHPQCISPERLQVKFLFSPFGLRGVVCNMNSLLSLLSAGQLWLEQVLATEIKMQKMHCAEARKRQLDENVGLFA